MAKHMVVPMISEIKALPLFDTTSGSCGGQSGLCWRTSRESHPSEDLSELPPLLEAVAGQEYHCGPTVSWQGQAATACRADGRVALGTLLGRL